MGWISETPAPHYLCARPVPDGRGAGSTWECDVCGRRWRFDGWYRSIYGNRRASWVELRPDLAAQALTPLFDENPVDQS